MKIAALIFVILSLPACVSYQYRHENLGSDGKVTAKYEVVIWKNAADTHMTGVDLTLADGTHLKLESSDESPDPNVVTAVKDVGLALTALGSRIAAFFGF